MKNRIYTLFTLLLLISSVVVVAQNKTDANGQKQGKWRKYHEDNKTVRYVGQFTDDKPVGKFVFYYRTGEPSMVMEYGNDETAVCKSYHLNGSLMSTGKYIGKKKEGVWWYFNDQKKVIRKENYKDGLLDGKTFLYFPSDPKGNLLVLEQRYYEKGLEQGEWARYYKDGKIQVKGLNKDGLDFGERTWYTPSGKVDIVGYYKDGKKSGWWRYYKGDEVEKHFYLLGVELKGEALEKYLEAKKKKKQKK